MINSQAKVRRMNARQRKKHHVAEFTMYGFAAEVYVRDYKHADQVSDILMDIVEARGAHLWGCYSPEKPHKFECTFMPDGATWRRSLNDGLRTNLLEDIVTAGLKLAAVSDLYDLNYGEDKALWVSLDQ